MEWQFHAVDASLALSVRPAFSVFLRASCTVESDCDSAEVIFGELVANVIRHAPGPIDITVQSDVRGTVELDVRDTGTGFTFAPCLPECAFSDHGRGLYIISQLCTHVSSTPIAHGNVVRVILPVTATPSHLHLVQQIHGEIESSRAHRTAATSQTS